MTEKTYYVDIPTLTPGEWTCIDQFGTEEEAIEFIKEHFGGDDEGRVSLITEGEWV